MYCISRDQYVLLLLEYYLAHYDLGLLYKRYRLETCGCTFTTARFGDYARRHSSVYFWIKDQTLAVAANGSCDDHGNIRLITRTRDARQYGNDDRILGTFSDCLWLVYQQTDESSPLLFLPVFS